MAVQEGLGGLGGVGLDEAVGFPFHSPDEHQGLAKVALGVARRMGQRHEHLLRPPPALPYVVLDDGVLAVEPVLFPEPLEDALGGVALLPETPEIVLQDPSMTPVKGSNLGLLGGLCLRYPGGTDQASILRTVSRCRPNSLETSRILLPSTITARRTRRYTSTLYIHRTIRRVGYDPMNGGGRYSIQSPIASNLPPARSTLTPPFTLPVSYSLAKISELIRTPDRPQNPNYSRDSRIQVK